MKSIKVLGKVFKIKYKSMPLDKSEPTAIGLFYPDKNLILISKDLSKEMMLVTLIHEVIHALIDRCGLSQTSLTTDQEEIICEVVATFIVENFLVIQDSKDKPARQHKKKP